MQNSNASVDLSPVHRFAALWQCSNGDPPDVFEFLADQSNVSADEIGEICSLDQAYRWRSRIEFPVERYLEIFSATLDKRLKLGLIRDEFRCRAEREPKPNIEGFIARFPDLAEILRKVLSAEEIPTGDFPAGSGSGGLNDTILMRERGGGAPKPGSRNAETDASQLAPEYIGRYRVIRILGDGGFGRVYLAFDDVLNREIAIKIAHRNQISNPADIESYLTEARIVSSLDHSAIVPVYDCGRADDGICFVVSKYIDGSDLATKIKRTPFSSAASAELVISVAEALHFAHVKGVVHRDVKPANILIDSNGRTYLADFGIALREEDFGTGYTRLGTLAYMSPEQLRGEGHLVDGRSDIFSLGVVLYELLTGKRPFHSNRLAHSTIPIDPKPPRQIDDTISRELERICLKAMSYRVIDRYSAAIDMAADLRLFLQQGTASHVAPPVVAGLSGNSAPASSGHLSHVAGDAGIRIVPKGLRSFDRDDASFFLELLPGARDRDGIPESVRFWKSRIQSPDSETFRVGVIYGPSGSGKSSFLKAGVLPLLPKEITSIYLESTPLETESRLLKALRKTFPHLPADLGLTDSLAAIRRQRRGIPGQRLLIVIDQFEQWLHARSQGDSSELVRALRQCDGVNVQCILTVRDDFWMAVTSFMSELEVDLIPGDNLAVLDLFNTRHARKVLTAIGCAYGILPQNLQDLSEADKAFINKAVSDLAHNGQVIPVQLALFAEMVKDKAWTLATLKAVGGTAGVGVTFLEETFSGRTAHPHHRLHQKAARAVLQALLSDGSSGIKGAMRSYQELLQISGYTDNPQEFTALLRILDSELRLITPTEPDAIDSGHLGRATTDTKYYHLSHDYLVPSLQEWLTRKQKETRRGRAELLLADRVAMWNQQPTKRSLPTFLEWMSILLFAGRRSKWEHQKYLAAAAIFYGSRTFAGLLVLMLISWGLRVQIAHTRAAGMVQLLTNAPTRELAPIIEQLAPYRKVANPMLRQLAGSEGQSENTPRQRLHSAMALLPEEPAQLPTISEELLQCRADDFDAICGILQKWGNRSLLIKSLWTELLAPASETNTGRRLRAGAALASLDPPVPSNPSTDWINSSSFLANQLVTEVRTNPGTFNAWVNALRPLRTILYTELDRIFTKSSGQDYTASTILADFMADEATRLADLTVRATPRDYSTFLIPLRKLGDAAKLVLLTEFNQTSSAAHSQDVQFKNDRRRAHAAVALLEFSVVDPVVTLLTAPVDSMLSTYTEDRIGNVNCHPEILLRLIGQADTPLRAALVRSLGGISFKQIPLEHRDPLTTTITQLYQQDPDGGVHSAAEWALKSWDLKDRVTQFTNEAATNKPIADNHWFVNAQGQTFIIFKGPITVMMGSPPDEPGRDPSDEQTITRVIQRDFAVCTTEVTTEHFLRFLPEFRHKDKQLDYAPKPDCPIGRLTWYRAAEYCNWLSKITGIPQDQWCYKEVEQFLPTAKRPMGEGQLTMQHVPDYLSKTGYRLLTDAEWEFACRAGTATAYGWGSDPQPCSRYTYSIVNSGGLMHPVGTLCPNRFGLFDMHGNAAEWTDSTYEKTRVAHAQDDEDMTAIVHETEFVTRGTTSADLVAYQRSANRSPTSAFNGPSPRLGFRIARTLQTTSDSK